MASGWNPRYVAYAMSNGRTPAQQLAHDEGKPGSMVGFICWINAEIGRARCEIPEAFTPLGSLIDHDSFDAWLSARHAPSAAA